MPVQESALLTEIASYAGLACTITPFKNYIHMRLLQYFQLNFTDGSLVRIV